jgi:tryptophan synthase alpha subunit
MGRINSLIAHVQKIRRRDRMALCGYFLAGYPTPEEFYRAVRAAGRLDVIEFGLPSVEPRLDGPVISGAHQVVVGERGLYTETALALLGGLRDLAQPRLVMTYAREGRELDGFLSLCEKNAISAILAPDLEVDEAAYVSERAHWLGLAFVGFGSNTMPRARVAEMARMSDMMYVQLAKGPTGSRLTLGEEQLAELRELAAFVRESNGDALVIGGIGIQSGEQVARLAEADLDMVVVGTKLVHCLQEDQLDLESCLEELSNATRGQTGERALLSDGDSEPVAQR